MPTFSAPNLAATVQILLFTFTMLLQLNAAVAAEAAVSAQSDNASAERKPVLLSVELPLIAGWHEGQVVYYISTEASDKATAKKMGVNYAPRLEAAISLPFRAPGQASVLERIYSVTNFKQGNVLPSMPQPTGPNSTNPHYSPLWLIYTVTWMPNQKARVLRSEEEVLAAADKKQLTIQPTRIVVNCPVIVSGQGGALAQAKFKPVGSDAGTNK